MQHSHRHPAPECSGGGAADAGATHREAVLHCEGVCGLRCPTSISEVKRSTLATLGRPRGRSCLQQIEHSAACMVSAYLLTGVVPRNRLCIEGSNDIAASVFALILRSGEGSHESEGSSYVSCVVRARTRAALEAAGLPTPKNALIRQARLRALEAVVNVVVGVVAQHCTMFARRAAHIEEQSISRRRRCRCLLRMTARRSMQRERKCHESRSFWAIASRGSGDRAG